MLIPFKWFKNLAKNLPMLQSIIIIITKWILREIDIFNNKFQCYTKHEDRLYLLSGGHVFKDLGEIPNSLADKEHIVICAEVENSGTIPQLHQRLTIVPWFDLLQLFLYLWYLWTDHSKDSASGALAMGTLTQR